MSTLRLAWLFIIKFYDWWCMPFTSREKLFYIANLYIKKYFSIYKGNCEEIIFQKYAKVLYNYKISTIMKIE